MAPEVETVRNPIPLIMHVAVVLYKLGSCAEYRIVLTAQRRYLQHKGRGFDSQGTHILTKNV